MKVIQSTLDTAVYNLKKTISYSYKFTLVTTLYLFFVKYEFLWAYQSVMTFEHLDVGILCIFILTVFVMLLVA